MDSMKEKLYESLFFDIHSYTYSDEDVCSELFSCDIKGCRIKKFYNVDSKLFGKYFNDRGNYITSINEEVEVGIVPSKVLILEKVCALDRYRYTTHGRWLLHSEMMGTQLMNFFGCPCACNVAIQKSDKEDGNCDIFSMNFIGEGDRFYTLADLGCSFSRGLEATINHLERVLDSDIFIDYDKKEKERMLEDFVYSYLVRKYVARDTDFFQGNCGVIANKEKGTLQYVNFDLEYSYGESKPGLSKDLEFCASRFPLVYARFEQMVELYRKNLNELKDEGISYQSYIQEQNVLVLACALREVSDCLEDRRIDTALKTHY